MPTMERSVHIKAPANRVFAYVDDIRNLARHMSEGRSMAMMGSRLKLEILSPNTTGIGATYRYSGRMMGLDLDFSETVFRYVPGREKAWRTIGTPRLLIIRAYEMWVKVEPRTGDSANLTIGIDYLLPAAGFWRLAGKALAGVYARWCLDNMTEGSKRALQAGEQ